MLSFAQLVWNNCIITKDPKKCELKLYFLAGYHSIADTNTEGWLLKILSWVEIFDTLKKLSNKKKISMWEKKLVKSVSFERRAISFTGPEKSLDDNGTPNNSTSSKNYTLGSQKPASGYFR